MSLVTFEELPDRARLWIFPADRSPSPSETARLLDRMSGFLEEWTAHDARLHAALDWRHHRFLLVAVDEHEVEASGCSIDALMRQLATLEEELDLTLTDYSPVWFLDEEERICRVSRDRFREAAGEGRVGPETTVFDPTVESVADIRQRRWKSPAGDSWHRRLLPEVARDRAETGAS